MVPLARALANAGHDVAFAVAPGFRTNVEAVGITSFAVGRDYSLFDLKQADAQLRDVARPGEFFMSAALKPLVPDLLQVARDWRPDLIVRDLWEIGATLVAEILGLPHATVGITEPLPMNAFAGYFGETLAELRRDNGLAPDPTFAQLSGFLYLDLVPPSYHGSSAALPAISHRVRPLVFDDANDEPLPSWVEEPSSGPRVYATLGTVVNQQVAVFQAILSALREEPVELVLTVGRNVDVAAFGPQPSSVHVERYIPQSRLFPTCDVVLCHAGYNTIIAALTHGLPMLVMPLSAPQVVDAHRCVDLGVAEGLTFEGLDVGSRREVEATREFRGISAYRPLNPGTIRAAVKLLLAEPRYRQRAGRIQEEIFSLPGPERAVELLERLSRERAPIAANPSA